MVLNSNLVKFCQHIVIYSSIKKSIFTETFGCRMLSTNAISSKSPLQSIRIIKITFQFSSFLFSKVLKYSSKLNMNIY